MFWNFVLAFIVFSAVLEYCVAYFPLQPPSLSAGSDSAIEARLHHGLHRGLHSGLHQLHRRSLGGKALHTTAEVQEVLSHQSRISEYSELLLSTVYITKYSEVLLSTVTY